MKNKKWIYCSLIVFSITIIFFFRDFRIGFKEYKFGEGYHLGDMIDFDYNFSFTQNDTLYISETPVALLQDYSFRIIDDKIVITSIDRKKRGFYFSK